MKKKEELYSCSQQDHNAMAETDIKMVPIADLHDFEGHPFKVENDMALFELMQSIEKEGVIVPALARPRAEGGYELIAGHRRKAASKWAGLDVMPVVIRELDDNQAVIAMVDSNLQREHLKPSEKAFAYKMKLDAMKRQGARTDLTFCQVGEKLENPTLRVYFLLRGKMKQICLYLKKNMDIDGEVEDKPIANSLKELINNMNVNPNIRKKEENKCCL